jgi:anti-anti-sigma factor
MGWYNRFGVRLMAVTIVFLLMIGAATAGLINWGFQLTQRDASDRSQAILLQQQRAALAEFTNREAKIAASELLDAPFSAYQAIALMGRFNTVGSLWPVDPNIQLAQQPNGAYTDISPNPRSSTYLDRSRTVNSEVIADLQESSIFDSVFPEMFRLIPSAVAVYYIGPSSFSRYYPVNNSVESVGADFDALITPWYALATPANNPERKSIWIDPYLDPAGQGLLVTNSTPVYVGDTFRGVFCIDLSLNRVIANLDAIKPTPNSFALLVDSNEKLVAASTEGMARLPQLIPGTNATITDTLALDMNTSSNPEFRNVLADMQNNERGTAQIRVGDEPVLLSYATLPEIGWRLLIVMPISDIIAPVQGVAREIEQGTATTLRNALLVLGGFLLLGLIGVVIVSQIVTRPIRTLVAGTKAVAAGDLSTTIKIRSGDEFSRLADSFNAMIADLAAARQHEEQNQASLEQMVQDRTAALQTQTNRLQESLAQRQQLTETIAALSVPVLPVRDDVLIVPLVGTVDSQRGTLLMTTVLDAISDRRTQMVVLDVTGLALIDTNMAQLLLQTADAVRLLGAEILLVGIRPEVAQTLVSLGVDLRRLPTAATLQQAMALIDERYLPHLR